MRNAGLEEAQAGIKIAGRNINNLRYADDITLMEKSEEELKSSLMKVKEPPGLGGSDVGHPGYHGVWSSSPGLHPPRAGGPAPLLLKSHQPKMSPKIAQSPLGTKSPLVETCCSRFIHLGLEDRATRQGAFPCS